MNICVFASGKGSNFNALLEGVNSGKINGKIKLLISDREGCGAGKTAEKNGIPFLCLKAGDFKSEQEYSERLGEICSENKTDLICLAGYLSQLPQNFVKAWYGKIINIHPSLLPSFGGKGFYGEKVHKAVLESGVKISGATVHFVSAEYDKGPIIAQESVFVYQGDTPETLAERILKTEHRLYSETAALFCEKRIILKDGKTEILPPERIQKIKRALISVSDKTGVVAFARGLEKNGVEIISTGGTYKLLRENGIGAVSVDAFSGFPEIFDGRVKTLNNKIFGGILFKREEAAHLKDAFLNGIKSIDLVAVNLYPFSEAAKTEENWSEKLIENIDIGGVALLRAAAKNYKDVITVCDSGDYAEILSGIEAGTAGAELKKKLAVKAFNHTAEYDAAIHSKLSSGRIICGKEHMDLFLNKLFDLRYGENPHQKAALYSVNSRLPFEKLNGKELSYNNILDAYGSFSAVSDFKEPACVIFKHMTPCGIGRGENAGEAFERAWSCDPLSAFGGIIALNGKVDLKIAAFLSKKFIELIIAPDYEKEALALLAKKTNLRILKWHGTGAVYPVFKSLGAEFLISDNDIPVFGEKWEKAAGELSSLEEKALRFAFTCVKHVRSNAIVLADSFKTVGIGAGQMSRVDSVFMAGHKYSEYLKSNPKPEIIVMASDAFFPFEDAIEEAKKTGVTAIVQPGGSIRDKEVVETAKKLGIKMVLTGMRHFKH